MNWVVCFVLSVILLTAAIVTVIYCEKKKIKRNKLLSSFKILMYGVAAACFFLYLPYYYNVSLTDLKGLHTFLISFVKVISTFGIGGDYSFFMESTDAGSMIFNTVYLTYTLLLMTAAPFFTFGVVLSFFKDVTAYFNYYIRRDNITYVFSELNERSITLAEDLRANHPKALLLFAGVHRKEKDAENELEDKASDIGAICFQKDILSLKLRLQKLTKKTCFFVISARESENLSQTIKLIDTYKNRADTELYLFSTSVESELVLTSISKGKMKVRRVNEVRSLINRMLYDEGHVLFDSARPAEDGRKLISAVIVGLGQYGTIILKALTWFCQMNGYRVNITAIDRDENAEEKFTAQCPALMAKENRGVYIEGEAEYDITIHSGVDVDSKAFMDIIMDLPETTYVFTALGTDEDNVRVAVNLRMMFERLKISPIIQAVVHSSEEKAALEGIHNHAKQPYNLRFIGDIKSSYTEKVIIKSELEREGLNCHMGWDGSKESDFWEYEYCYRSSIASAIHMKARVHCKIPGANKVNADQSVEEQRIIGDLEHRRWNAYMRAEGYVYSGSNDKTTRNYLGKMHQDLVPTSWLSEDEFNKDIRVGTL